jgi:hypothetical protein
MTKTQVTFLINQAQNVLNLFNLVKEIVLTRSNIKEFLKQSSYNYSNEINFEDI